jgi:hypothetical protein
MNIDERLEFLMRSTESLYASVQELHAVVSEHTRQLEIDAQNIRSLANIAAAHEGRLDNLEGR